MSTLATGAGGQRAALAAEVCALVDAAAPGPVLVYGSPPPDGRDLDLLLRARDEPAVRDALRAAGLAERGDELVRFGCGAAYAVSLDRAEALGLADAEVAELFAGSSPLAGFRQLRRPSAEHRRLVRARLADARTAAPLGRRMIRALLPRWIRLRLPRPRRGALVALSGIDGAGKSFQARALASALTDLGYEVTVEWLPLGQNRSLDRLARPVKRILRRGAGLGVGARPGAGEPDSDAGADLRARRPALNSTWATVVALANALTHLRRALPQLLAGRVVIFDRYALDSVVRLGFSYGPAAGFPVQRWLIRALSPRPLCAFFLEIPAEVSLARKEDRWRAEELRAHVALYRRELPLWGVRRLDGERPAEELAAEIAETVWRALRQR